MRRKYIKLALVLSIVMTIIGVAACSSAPLATQPLKTGAPGPSAGRPEPKTRPADAAPEKQAQKVYGSGNTAIVTDAKLMFGTGGKIEKLNVKKGDRVTKGTVLAKLETNSLELAVSQAKTALAQANLAQSKAHLDVAQAEATLESARFDLDRMKEVDELKDKIATAETRRIVAEEGMKAASLGNDITSNQYWQKQIQQAVKDKADYQKTLTDLLGTDRFKTLKVNSQTVNEAMVKQRQVEAAELSVEQARRSITYSDNNAETVTKALETAEKQLREATIIAPFDGMIATLDVKEGDIVPAPAQAQKPVIYLIDPTIMQLSVGINELDVPKAKIGQKAVVTIDALPGVKLEGKVSDISPVPVAQTGIIDYEVKVSFVVPSEVGVKVGMSGTAEITIN